MSAIENSTGDIIWLDELQSYNYATPVTKNTRKEHSKLYSQLADLFDEYDAVGRVRQGADILGTYTCGILGGNEVIKEGVISAIAVRPELMRFTGEDDRPFFVVDKLREKLDATEKTFGVTSSVTVEIVKGGDMQEVGPYVMRLVRKLIVGRGYIN